MFTDAVLFFAVTAMRLFHPSLLIAVFGVLFFPATLPTANAETGGEFPTPQPLEDPEQLLELPEVGDDIGAYLHFPRPRPPGDVKRLAVADNRLCALLHGGLLLCWSFDDDEVTWPRGLLVDIAAGGEDVCGLDSTARPVCLDDENWDLPDTPMVDIAVGDGYGCGVDTTGTPICWGRLDGEHRNPPSGPFQEIDAGGNHTCATGSFGPARCWGRDAFSSRPFGDPIQRLSVSSDAVCGIDGASRPRCQFSPAATPADPPATSAIDIAAGRGFVCTIDTTGTIACDGRDAPRLPERPPISTMIEAGEQTLCAVSSTGALNCWNRSGQVLGDQ